MSAAQVLGRALGVTLFACGAHFLVRAVTGKTPFEHAREFFAARRKPPPGPPATGKGERPWLPQPPTDPIDEASWESFPASDSPAYSGKPRQS